MGGAKWLGSDKHSIEAKAGEGEPNFAWSGGNADGESDARQLLAERLKLAGHRETKEEQVCELVIAKNGSKLKEADPTRSGRTGVGTTGPGRLEGMAASTGVLTQVLAHMLSRSVIDKTGLTGKYGFMLEYTPELGQFGFGPPGPPEDPGPPPPDPNGPSLFTVLQEQLGLRLESAKRPGRSLRYRSRRETRCQLNHCSWWG